MLLEEALVVALVVVVARHLHINAALY